MPIIQLVSRFAIVILALIVSNPAYSQFRLEDWKTHTSFYDTYASAVDSKGRLWVASSGGVFNYDKSTEEFKEFRNIDALLSLDVSAIATDIANQKVFIGSSDGILDIVTEDYQWTHILDIKNANFPNPVLNDIKFFDGKAFIAGGFGITLFDSENEVFIEDAFRLGSFQPNTNVRKILIYNNELWAATNEGIARASLSSSISPKDAWRNYSGDEGIYELPIIDIEVFNNDIYAISESKIYKMVQDSFVVIRDQPFLVDLSSNEKDLNFATLFNLSGLNTGPFNIAQPAFINSHNIHNISGTEYFIIHYKEKGIGFLSGDSLMHVLPNTPFTNVFRDLDVGPTGTVWAVADGGSGPSGIMKYQSGEWSNITPESISIDSIKNAIDNTFNIKAGNKDKLVISTWGSGLLLADIINDTLDYELFNSNNSPMTGGTNGFVLIGETVFDRNNDLWMVQFGGSSGGPLLLSLDDNKNFDSFPNMVSPSDRSYNYLAIDQSGTKWVGSSGGTGLYYYNEMNTLTQTTDDISGIFRTTNSKLIDNYQNCLAVDKSGMVWVGTPSGISVIINPYSVLSNSGTIIRDEIPALRNTFINDIMIDALNYKWVATPDGVWVLDEEGSEVLAIINKDNSPLVSNEVLSLSNDPKTGRVFMGTKRGMTEVKSLSVEPLPIYDLSVYPQPFYPIRDKEIVIDGLAADSEIKIVTTSGKLVKSINALGRTAVWDGKDLYDRPAASGIYLVLASSATTNSESVAKIALIRE